MVEQLQHCKHWEPTYEGFFTLLIVSMTMAYYIAAYQKVLKISTNVEHTESTLKMFELLRLVHHLSREICSRVMTTAVMVIIPVDPES